MLMLVSGRVLTLVKNGMVFGRHDTGCNFGTFPLDPVRCCYLLGSEPDVSLHIPK